MAFFVEVWKSLFKFLQAVTMLMFSLVFHLFNSLKQNKQNAVQIYVN